ncbi:hypothetical protein G6F61_010022 [Rhizopus arrhizus]|nr:hypothetical protein G6F24_011004 [Rhizopus arrhizus]KAG1373624.1 hypothetical protein G6F61_010022 [Rhizopus arrhizus]
MKSISDKLIQSLICISCGDILIDPVTLSCGYTTCSRCLSTNSPTKQSLFKCPSPHCNAAAHLFGPELLQDTTITQLVHTFRYFVSNAVKLPLSPRSDDDKPTNFIPSNIVSLFKCPCCRLTFVEPTTTPCGHTFCRICLLKSKAENDICKTCLRPLPKYNSLTAQHPNHILSSFVNQLELLGSLPYIYRDPLRFLDASYHQSNIPIFVSNKVVLPGQHTRLSILTPHQLSMFHKSLVPSSRYDLCLASVHRSNPQVAQFGTILQVVNIEHQNKVVMLDVVGVDRFKLVCHEEDTNGMIIANFEVLYEPMVPQIDFAYSSRDNSLTYQNISEYTADLANNIIEFVKHLGQSSSAPSHILHSQTTGLLGPLWLESAKLLHGQIPQKENPAAVCWWAATVLPVPTNDLYILLRTISLIDRLELVISWFQSFQSQWKNCRERAINAYLQIPQH